MKLRDAILILGVKIIMTNSGRTCLMRWRIVHKLLVKQRSLIVQLKRESEQENLLRGRF